MRGLNTLILIVISFEKRLFGDIKTDFVNSSDQLVDIFIKFLQGPRIGYISNKLGTYDLNAPA